MSDDDRLSTCEHRRGFDLIFTSDGETMRCPDCKREWIAVRSSHDSETGA